MIYQRNIVKSQIQSKGLKKTSLPDYYSLTQRANGPGLRLKSCRSKNKKANQFQVDIVYCELRSQLFYSYDSVK